MRKNYSKDSEYHSQRNNMVVPYSSCNTTSMVMALKQAGWEVPGGDAQPEDSLSNHLQTDMAYSKQKALAPWSIGAYPPQEVHSILEWGVNDWMHADVDTFTTKATENYIFKQLDMGGGVVLSGRFPVSGGELGHIVSLAGFYSDSRGPGGIIDDPYGAWAVDYRDPHGNDIDVSATDFDRIFKKEGSYWAHFIEVAK